MERRAEENWAYYTVSRLKKRAIRLNLPFDLMDHLDELNERFRRGVCELTGLPIRRAKGGTQWDSASLDRIDPKAGYVYSNVRIVCFGMNAALGHWGEQVFRRIATAYLERK